MSFLWCLSSPSLSSNSRILLCVCMGVEKERKTTNCELDKQRETTTCCNAHSIINNLSSLNSFVKMFYQSLVKKGLKTILKSRKQPQTWLSFKIENAHFFTSKKAVVRMIFDQTHSFNMTL